MIAVTERAKQQLKYILIVSEADPDERLRLLPSPDGVFVLALDTGISGDQMVEYEGSKVLLVGIEYLKILDGKKVGCFSRPFLIARILGLSVR